MDKTDICNEGIENLRFAIVKQAIEDYDKALKFLHNPKNKSHKDYQIMQRLKNDCESFFAERGSLNCVI